jgi:2'-5' RNA ligase
VSKPKAHRLFFALNPPDRVRAQVHAFQQALDVQGRAVPPENFHVTLAFLGMQAPEVIPGVRRVAAQVSFEPCRVALNGIGHFRQAGVLWLGASQVPAVLQAFQHSLVSALLQAGIGYDRKPWSVNRGVEYHEIGHWLPGSKAKL